MAAAGSPSEKVSSLIASHPLVVFSKSYCPYCTRTKGLLSSLDATPYVVELDKVADGSAMQEALIALTGQRTVPNTFVSGKSYGGNDDLHRLHNDGKLVPLLKTAGVVH